MTGLPAELLPWRGMLSLFPEDLAGEIGRLVPRLSLAVGPMRAALPVPSGEPDGFSGIVRRGSYERLLLSEWLLADEAPEEFSRRAAMGEHAFFHLARRTPSRAMSSVAVFDAGPDQLGAPRLAHLAALIVLASRAERAGARFAWGMLGAPEAALVPAVTPQSVLGLLGARTAVASDGADLAAWSERAAKSGWEDLWLVGRAPSSDWKHATLEVRDVLDPARRALSLTVRAPRSPPREVDLELPEPRASVRLLRDPFTVTAPAPRPEPRAPAPTSNLVFAVNGTKLFARGASGEILSYPVPNSARAPAGRPKRFRAHTAGVVAAVGWVKRGLAMLVMTPTSLALEHTTLRGPHLLRRLVERAGGPRVATPSPSDPLSPLVYEESAEEGVLFLDARRALFRLHEVGGKDTLGRREVRVDLVASEVSALASAPTHVLFVGRNAEKPAGPDTPRMGVQTVAPGAVPTLDSAWHVASMRFDGQAGSKEVLLGGTGTYEAVVGRELVAVQQQADTWTIHGRSGSTSVLTPPEGATVVGVHPSGPSSTPELLLLDGDARTLGFFGGTTLRKLPRAAAPIVDVATNAWRGQLAYVTSRGEVVIHSIHENAPLVRYAPE